MATVALETLGCKLNQAETESLSRQFSKAGFRLVGPRDRADVYVLNTCTVTHIADRKSRHLLRLARRRNPQALIVATGCYAVRAPQETAQIEGVRNVEKGWLVERVRALFPFLDIEGEAIDTSALFRTRALVKVQEGCHQSCSYCVVPGIRGRGRSITPAQVVGEVRNRVAGGYREVVLTGTQIGDYGRDLAGEDCLEHLVGRILSETEVERLRISSLQPQAITSGLVELLSQGRLCRHLHLPLQSGSDAVLRRMRRRYSTEEYRKAVTSLREAVPDMAVTTDVMVGFPGESEEEFRESYQFCQEMEFAGIHVFPYSPRPGTPAAQMPHGVDERIKKGRADRMLELSRRSGQHFRGRFLGRTMPVLWERQKINGEDRVWEGLTDNYIRVFARTPEDLANKLVPTKLVRWGEGGVWGSL